MSKLLSLCVHMCLGPSPIQMAFQDAGLNITYDVEEQR